MPVASICARAYGAQPAASDLIPGHLLGNRRRYIFGLGRNDLDRKINCCGGSRLQLASAPFRSDGFARGFFTVLLRMNTELMPVRLGQVYAVMMRSFLDVSERQSPISV